MARQLPSHRDFLHYLRHSDTLLIRPFSRRHHHSIIKPATEGMEEITIIFAIQFASDTFRFSDFLLWLFDFRKEKFALRSRSGLRALDFVGGKTFPYFYSNAKVHIERKDFRSRSFNLSWKSKRFSKPFHSPMFQCCSMLLGGAREVEIPV